MGFPLHFFKQGTLTGGTIENRDDPADPATIFDLQPIDRVGLVGNVPDAQVVIEVFHNLGEGGHRAHGRVACASGFSVPAAIESAAAATRAASAGGTTESSDGLET